jgi:hypothetical protein
MSIERSCLEVKAATLRGLWSATCEVGGAFGKRMAFVMGG